MVKSIKGKQLKCSETLTADSNCFAQGKSRERLALIFIRKFQALITVLSVMNFVIGRSTMFL